MKKKYKDILRLSIVIFALILINIAAQIKFKRIDLTSDKRYTLSPFTKETLRNLDGQITITILLDGDNLPVRFQKFRSAIKETLQEFEVYAGDKLTYKFLNPTDENMDKNERIALYKHLQELGIMPVQMEEISQGEVSKIMLFPSVIITYTTTRNDSVYSYDYGLNLLLKDPNYEPTSEENINNSIANLEYNLINEIYRITLKKKPKIAFLEGHGELDEIFVLDMERTLGQYYDIRRGRMGGTYGILDDFDVVIVAKPTKPFSKEDKFVLDQYLMKGGKILWLVDGVNVDMDSIFYYDKAFAFPANTEELKLNDMFFSYGFRINSDLLQDMYCSPIRLIGVSATGQQQYHTFNWYYFPLLISKENHVINKHIDAIHTNFISSIDTIGTRPGIKRTVLLSTSELSRIIPVNFPYEIRLSEVNNQVDKNLFDKQNIPVSILLEGSFRSAFKGHVVNSMLPPGEKFIDQSKPTKMIVVSDGDIIRNAVTSKGEVVPLDVDKYSNMRFSGNKEFLLNAVNYLCDEQGLMNLRNREFKLRLLSKDKIISQKTFWEIFNTFAPLLLILVFILIINYIHKKKYSK